MVLPYKFIPKGPFVAPDRPHFKGKKYFVPGSFSALFLMAHASIYTINAMKNPLKLFFLIISSSYSRF
jgi:hypothetical protein